MCMSIAFRGSAQEFKCGPGAPAICAEALQDLPVVIDSPPMSVRLAVDLYEYLTAGVTARSNMCASD